MAFQAPNWLINPILQQQIKGVFGTGEGHGMDESTYTSGRYGEAADEILAGQTISTGYSQFGPSQVPSSQYIEWDPDTQEYVNRFSAGFYSSGVQGNPSYASVQSKINWLNANRGSDYIQTSDEFTDLRDTWQGDWATEVGEEGGIEYGAGDLFDPQALSEARAAFRGSGTVEPGTSFQPLSVSLFKEMNPAYYAGQVAKEKTPYLDELTTKIQTSKGIGGDFAGYGQRSVAEDILKSKYRTQVEDIHQDTEALTEGALGEFLDIIQSYRDYPV